MEIKCKNFNKCGQAVERRYEPKMGVSCFLCKSERRKAAARIHNRESRKVKAK
jgi:hypothetical protein